jgi:two-component system cell cycle sensor histidine kinase/response regulator CckA
MPSGGTLAMATARVTLDEEFIRGHGYGNVGDFVLISVSDSGIGMDAETRQKIFEPFFTTKEVGKGTGLGLSMVYGIVKQHKGYIDVYSEPGIGTTFKIYLPVDDHGADTTQSSSVALPEGGDETVLVAEDDAEVRSFLTGTLEHAGYRVIEAPDGGVALAEYARHRDAIALLVLDVVMPVKDGKEVLEEARKLDPAARCLFLSGYTGDIFQRRGLPEDGVNFISKPVSRAELLKVVRRLIDAG